MKPLTVSQRSGYHTAATVLYLLSAAAIFTGVWVGLEWPLGWLYGGLGILAGLLSGGIAFTVRLVALRAPAA